MCRIITWSDMKSKSHITDEEIVASAQSNSDGTGIAFVDRGRVYFEKGITIERALELFHQCKTPGLIHVRLATHGGVSDEMCHPFPVTTDLKAMRATSGHVDRVLAHNGVWCRYDAVLERLARKRPDLPIAKQRYSDSKAMALMAAIEGEEVLRHDCGGRTCVLDSKGLRLYGYGWEKSPGGYWCSYRMWRSEYALDENEPKGRPLHRVKPAEEAVTLLGANEGWEGL
jgi:predicted glutamine amidotransferase